LADDRLADFLTELKFVAGRLRFDPDTFGEELYELSKFNLTVRIAVRYPLAVEFGVSRTRRVVFVRDFTYL